MWGISGYFLSHTPAGTLQTRNARYLFRKLQRRRSLRCSTGRTPPGRPAHSSAEQGTLPGRKCRAFRRRLPAQRSSLRAEARGSLRFFPLRVACSSSEAAFLFRSGSAAGALPGCPRRRCSPRFPAFLCRAVRNPKGSR